MKTIKRLSVVFALIVAATISSCGGSDEPAVPVPPAQAIPATGTYINASSADGAAFTTVIMGQSAASAGRIGTGANNIITIIGGHVSLTPSATSRTISLELRGITAPGTYTMTSSGSNLSYITATSTGATPMAYNTVGCSGTSGSVTVTAVSATQIEGTFSFTGKNDGCAVSKSVAGGQFRAVFN